MQAILASLLLCSIALGGAVPAKRQSPTSPAVLAVYSGATRLGSVLAASDGSAATVTTGAGGMFYVEGSILNGPVNGTGVGGSHAFIVFPNLGFAGCGYFSGNLTFAASNSNKCASSGPFSATDGAVHYMHTFSGGLSSFQVCGPDQHIAWNAVGTSFSGCTDVTLVFEAPTPEPTSVAPSSAPSDASSPPVPASTDFPSSESIAPSSIPIPIPTSSDLTPTSSERPAASESAAL